MKLTKKLEAEIKKFMKTYWDTYLKGDLKTWATFLPTDYKNIGGTEEELWNSKKEILDYTKRVINQMAGQMEVRNTKYQIFPYDPYIMVHEFTDMFIKVDKKWTFYGKFRLSSIIQKTEGGWKVLHQHGSFPDSKAAEGEAFSVDTLKSENLKLQKAVKDRTAELQEKNRDLEIDAALERIRARSMAMHTSEELNDVLSVLFQQVELLGIDAKCAHLTLMDVENNRFSFRVTGRNGVKNIGEQIIDLDAMDAWKETVEKWKKSKPHSHQCLVYPPEVLPGLWELINESLQSLPAKERIRIKDYPDGVFDCEGHTKFGYIGFNNSRPPTEEEINIVVKFAREFERVYQRFLDIQKAEAQAREAQIEAALERIRAKSMAMQKPDDLNDVLSILFQQFDKLEIKPVNVWLSLLDLEKETFTYRATGTGGSRLHTNQVIGFYAMDIWEEALKQWKTDTPDSVLLTHYPNDIWPQLVEVFSETFMSMPEDERLKPEDFPNGLFNVQGYTKFGYLGFNHFREPTDEEKDILRKFAKEFERVYQRFLDIQKAEAQAREAHIEASLERVRAASMAMHQTEDIGKVVVVFFEQLKQLNIPFEQAWITIMHLEEGYFDTWFSPIDGIYNEPKHFKMPSAPFEESAIKPWKAGVPFSYLSLKTKKEVDQFLFACDAMTDSTYFSHAQKILKNERYEFLEARHNYGFISKTTKDNPTKEDEDLLQRFGKVFEQTYTRFLDLQKAEAQAREAQIEAALEKVRSRSLEMHRSDELQDVVQVVAEKLTELGVVLEIGGIAICTYFENSKDVMHWTASNNPLMPSKPYYIEHYDTPMNNEPWAAKLKGETFFEKVFSAKDNRHYFDNALENTAYKNLPEEYKDLLRNTPQHGLTFALQKNSSLMVPSLEGKLLKEEDKVILIRFSNVFEQAYIRFLDLQKAEAQAREAQIEMALEKVRSRSLAMHNSKELQQVVNVVYDQLKELGLQSHAVAMSGVIKPQSAYEVWVGGSTFSEPLVIPYTDSTQVQREYNEVIESRPELFCKTYSGEIMKEYFNFLMQENEFPDEIEKLMLECEAFSTTLTFAKNSGMQLVRYSAEPYTDAENKLLIRFQNVFEQAYVRFMDLQKAEAQTREAQIETALERVRARSMAMQSSTELHEILGILFRQFDNLGIKPVNVFLSLFNRENRTLTYRASGKSGTRIPGMQVVKVDSMEALTALFDKWLTDNSDSVEVIHYPKEVLPQLFGIFAETYAAMPEEDRMGPEDFPDGGYSMAGYTPFGYLGYDHQRQATEEEKDILSRFCIEFTRVYQRFLDIQKAEAQAREAQIEMALERVRSRTMAMHQSQELKEVIYTTFDQMKSLDITINFCAIDIHGENIEDLNLWVAAPDQNYAELQVVPFFDHPLVIQTAAAKKRNDTDFVIHLSGEENRKFYEHIFEHTSFKESMSDERKQMILQTKGQDLIGSCLPQSALFISNFQGYVYTDKERNTLLRFAKVFEQAYTRFLDLQKAEAQARDAQIEMALERVRARSMAMHQTDELSDVLCVLFEQFDFLGINPVLTHLTLMDEANETFTLRITTSPKERVFAEQKIDINAVESWKASFENWKKGEPNTVDCIDYPPEVLPFVWEVLREVMTALPEGHKINPEDFPDGLYTTQGHFKFGYLGFNHSRRATEEEKNIVSRFATEFGRVYQRFLDIQKAEAQAREAQIEAALERVRSQAMAMQNSDDLIKCTAVVFEELEKLNLKIERSGIGIFDAESKDCHLWTTVVGKDGNRELATGITSLTIHPLLVNTFEAWEKQEPYAYVLEGKELEDYYRIVEKSEFHLSKESIDKSASLQKEYYLYTPFKAGGLYLFSDVEPANSDKQIIKRFADVFHQTYTRYEDLQKAEARTRESEIQLALERVRARTMAMHNSNELGEVASVLFEQISLLTNTPDRFNIGIANEEDRTYDVWVTDQQGHKISKLFVAAADKSPVIFEVFEAWKRKENFIVQDLFGEQLEGWLQYMGKELGIPFDKNQVKDHRYINSVFFSHGFIGITTNESPDPETLKLIERFAKVFQQTYTRFLDLQKAEAQAREAQIQLSLERVRAKAMAMRESEELTEVLPIIFEQLDGLGVKTVWTHLTLIDVEKNTFTYRMTGREGKRVYAEQVVDLDASEIWKDAAETFKSEKPDAIARFYFPSESLPGIWEIFDEIFSTLPEGFKIHPEDFPGGIFTTQANCEFGYIGINNTEKATEEEENILHRFAKEFGRLYQRFLDLQKAEAQSREAMIEASLERIRAKAMAMQHTEELNEVIGLLCEQYDILGIDPVCAHLSLIDLENDRFSLRLTGKKGARNVGEQIIDANAMPVWAESLEKWKNSEPLSHQCLVYPLEQVPTVMSILDGVISTMPEEARISAADFPNGLFSCEGQNKFGNLGFNHSRPPTEEEIEIVKRFAREFERIYQRFLDLEKAEAQAREAQVEAGLERVRSRTMAMQNSDELAETSVVVFKQLIDLGIEPNRLYIGIITDNTGEIEFWATDEDGSKISSKFTGNKNNNTALLKMYDAWLAKEKSLTIDMQGKELEEYFNYLGNELHVPFKEGLLQKRRVQTMSFFSKGFIGIASPEEQPEATTKLLERFAAVFNLTFTRFNDLKIAEANTLKAEQDLIEIKAAKQSAEKSLTELQSTQRQLIQSEKMASLGELTAGIAHEIQNPLNFVNNFSEVSKELLDEMKEEMEKGNMDDVRDIMKDVIQNLEKINHHGKRADGIVKGMLQHSRSSSGTKEPTDINALADEYLRLAYHGLRAKDKSFNATMKTDYDESLQKVNVIPQDIGRVILNLITNAFYAVTEKKKSPHPLKGGNEAYEPIVSIATKRLGPPSGNGGKVEIKVSDNGGGMPDAIKEKIFQPFFTTKPTGKGTGLGLSLAFDIVTKGHGGELKVETKEGEGTEFIILLPV